MAQQTNARKAALAGLGVMGTNHMRVLQNIPGIEIVGICDTDIQLNSPFAIYPDIEQLLIKEKPDFIVIAVPTKFHKEIALKCIEHDVPLLIEKPVSNSVKNGLEILKAAQKKELCTAIGHVERFNPVIQALKKEIENKQILSINIIRIGPIPPRITDVGILTDLAVHDIDLIRFLTGKAVLDSTIYKSRKIHNNHEDNAVLSLLLEEDTIANITTNWLTPFKKRKIEIATQESYFEADLITQELKEYSAYQDNDSFLTRNCFVKKGEPLFYELSAFVNYINTGDRANLASIEDSLLTLEILENAHRHSTTTTLP